MVNIAGTLTWLKGFDILKMVRRLQSRPEGADHDDAASCSRANDNA
jgi:hypothetical protein